MKKILLVVVIFVGCEANRWEGWVYPDRQDLTNDVPIGKFDSLEACRASAMDLIAQSDWNNLSVTYACGLDCEYNSDIESHVCEEIEL